MSTANHYKDLHDSCGKILSESFADAECLAKQTASLAYVKDLLIWEVVLKNRYEVSLLQSAMREYQYSLLALALGQYRQAFSALRLFFELALSMAQFSANEFEYVKWKKGARDIQWQGLVNPDNGPLSKLFVDSFFPELGPEAHQFKTMAEAVYRECSEYVHGNAQASEKLPKTLEFSKAIFLRWHELSGVMRLVICFAFSARYLISLDSDSRSKLAEEVKEQLGHIELIRVALV